MFSIYSLTGSGHASASVPHHARSIHTDHVHQVRSAQHPPSCICVIRFSFAGEGGKDEGVSLTVWKLCLPGSADTVW